MLGKCPGNSENKNGIIFESEDADKEIKIGDTVLIYKYTRLNKRGYSIVLFHYNYEKDNMVLAHFEHIRKEIISI